MNEIYKRIKEFCDEMGISEDAFYHEIGINKVNTKIDVRQLRSISKIYPQLNKDWLISGEGEMLNADFDGMQKTTLSRQERFKELLDVLGKRGIVSNQKELAEKLGYNSSYFSHLVNQRILTNELCMKLRELIPDVNIEYLMAGYGRLLVSDDGEQADEPDAVDESVSDAERLQELLREIAKQGERLDSAIEIFKAMITSKI